MKVILGENIEDLWLNLLIHSVSSPDTLYFHPSLSLRYVFAETSDFNFRNEKINEDFIYFSGYNHASKIGQLRKEYYTGKVEKQYNLIKSTLHGLKPRQARAAIYFSEPAFDATAKLKCLESLYFQKLNKNTYEAFLTFRNTEIFPKIFMDFVYIKELLEEMDRDAGVKCVGFKAIIINGFINLHQAKLIELFLFKWGVSNFSPQFKNMTEEFMIKYPEKKIETIKLMSIKRVLNRTYRIIEEGIIN